MPKFVIAGAAVGLALTLSGCGSDAASDAVSSAAAQVSEAVSSAAAEASEAASSVAAEASEAASSALAEASEAVSSAKAEVTYTMDDVSQHASSGDCWVAIDGKVYDLTKWEDQHPGGKDKIVPLCGTDATSAFSGQHGEQMAPNAALLGFLIGKLG